MIDLELPSCIAEIIFMIMSIPDREREYILNDTSVHSSLYGVIHSIMSAFYRDCST